MDALLRRLPDAAYFRRNGARYAGFIAGALATILLAMLFSVIYQGRGFGALPQEPTTVVYPNF